MYWPSPVNYSDPFGLCTFGKDCLQAFLNAARPFFQKETWIEARSILLKSGALGIAGPATFAIGRAGALRAAAGHADPLAGTRYTAKVQDQMAGSDYHSFPASVDGYAKLGTSTEFVGGDGITRTRVTLPGSMRVTDKQGNTKMVDGRFEWIIEPDRTINRRKFQPNSPR
jgi:hypothetical protein